MVRTGVRQSDRNASHQALRHKCTDYSPISCSLQIALLSIPFDFSSLGAKTNLLLFFFVKKDIILYTEA